MNFTLGTSVLAIGLFLAMVLLQETGRRIGLWRLAHDFKGAQAGFGVVEGAVFALIGLLVAFTLPMLLLPALNAMIDITTTRTMATQIHPPLVIFALLCVLALAGSLLAGYSMAGSQARSWTHMIGFAVIIAVTVYVIFDLEYPRLGLIRVDAADQVLVELRDSMK
jgi:hypothetical protein